MSGTWSSSTQRRTRGGPEETAEGARVVAVPDAGALAALLDEYAPFGPVPLVPEVQVFQGKVLLELWGAAERLAGGSLPPPFWGYPWPGGIALARYILDHPSVVAGARVLDLGAGGGVAALAAARAGAREVVVNDWDPWALATAALAAARQGLVVVPLAGDLTAASGAPEVPARYDVILCGDLYYERGVAPRIRAFLESARAGGAVVLVADAERAYFDSTGFTSLTEYRVPVPRDLEGADELPARVYQLSEVRP